MKTEAVMEVQENNSIHSFYKVGDNSMRRNKRLLAAILFVILSLLTACGNDSRYTYREAGITALKEGKYEEAIEAFDKALYTKKGLVKKVDIDILKYRAEAEYLSGNYQEAIQVYDKLIKADGKKPEYYNLRALSKAKTGDLEGAEKDYHKSTELDKDNHAPGRLEALLLIGASMEENGSADDAMKLYQAALDGDDTSARLLNRLGLCSMAKEDYDSAEGYFDQGLLAKDNQEVPDLLFNKAVAKEYKGEFKEALKLMQEYISVHGPDEKAEREITFLKTR